MASLERDPIINAIHNGMKRGIAVTLDNGCLDSCVILICAGIDAMAFLGMPEGKPKVERNDFIQWAENYIHFPCKEQLSGADLYGACCAMLHQYGVESDLSRTGSCRKIGYMDKSVPEVRYDPSKSKDLVMVSVPALKDAFFEGIDKFLVDAFADKTKRELVESRLRTFIQKLPGPGAK